MNISELQVSIVPATQAPNIALAGNHGDNREISNVATSSHVAAATSTASEVPLLEGTRSTPQHPKKRMREDGPLAHEQLNHEYLSEWARYAPATRTETTTVTATGHTMDVEDRSPPSYDEVIKLLEELKSHTMKEFTRSIQRIRKMQIALSRLLYQYNRGQLPKHLSLEFKVGNPFPACVPNSKQFLEDRVEAFKGMMRHFLEQDIEFMRSAINNALQEKETEFDPALLHMKIVGIAESLINDPRYNAAIDNTQAALFEQLGVISAHFQQKYEHLDQVFAEKQRKKASGQAASTTSPTASASAETPVGQTTSASVAPPEGRSTNAPATPTADRTASLNDATSAAEFNDIVDAKIDNRFNVAMSKFQSKLESKLEGMIKRALDNALGHDSSSKRKSKKDSKSSSSHQSEITTEDDADEDRNPSRSSTHNAAPNATSTHSSGPKDKVSNVASTTQPSNRNKNQRSSNDQTSNKSPMNFKEAVKKIPHDLIQKIAENVNKDGEWTFVTHKRPPKDPPSSNRNFSLWRNKNNNKKNHSPNQGNGWRHKNNKKN